jgi:hypothetical protein
MCFSGLLESWSLAAAIRRGWKDAGGEIPGKADFRLVYAVMPLGSGCILSNIPAPISDLSDIEEPDEEGRINV